MMRAWQPSGSIEKLIQIEDGQGILLERLVMEKRHRELSLSGRRLPADRQPKGPLDDLLVLR